MKQLLTLGLAGLLCACGGAAEKQAERPQPAAEPAEVVLELKSGAFAAGDTIPRQYTCEGEDVSPELTWRGAPEGTRTFALICDDPDAPGQTWVHWVIYNIPADVSQLPAGVAGDEELADGTRQGINDFKAIGYGGPCPPPGPEHRYFFKLYALSTPLDLPPGSTKNDLLAAMDGITLAEARLMGMYQR